jgi:DNA polymerase-1
MSTPQKKLFLLDAFALIFRGYYAFIKNPRINSQGLDTSAIMGFMNSLLDVIKREKPNHLAVCFDKGGSDIRNEMFPEYKANRLATPDAIKIAVPYIQEILKAMHIPVIEEAGFEADDLIGTLSKQAEKEGYQVYMVTPDKDFAQLVSENIFMYRPARMGNGIEILGVEEVKAKFEVETPLQIIDYLGMMGDAADNIPGLPGVGSKTAVKFLKEYGSMESLFEHSHELKGKMKEKVEANKELGLLSKKLATILLDCPVQFNEKDYELTPPDSEKVGALFNELEFRRVLTQFEQIFNVNRESGSNESKSVGLTKNNQNEDQFSLFGEPSSDGEENTTTKFYKDIEDTNHHYQLIEGDMGLKIVLQNLMKQPSVCFDTETTNLKFAFVNFSKAL